MHRWHAQRQQHALRRCVAGGKGNGLRPRCITYTQADESGASLRAAGWVKVKELDARKGWAESSVAMRDKRDPVGNGGVPRVLWEIRAEGASA